MLCVEWTNKPVLSLISFLFGSFALESKPLDNPAPVCISSSLQRVVGGSQRDALPCHRCRNRSSCLLYSVSYLVSQQMLTFPGMRIIRSLTEEDIRSCGKGYRVDRA